MHCAITDCSGSATVSWYIYFYVPTVATDTLWTALSQYWAICLVCDKYCFCNLLNPVNNDERGFVKQKFISAWPLSFVWVVVVLVNVKVLVVLSYWCWSPFFCTVATCFLKMQPLVRLITSVCDLSFPVMTPVLDNVLHCPLILIAIEKFILKVSFQITHQGA